MFTTIFIVCCLSCISLKCETIKIWNTSKMFLRYKIKKLVYSMMVNDNFHKSAMILTTRIVGSKVEDVQHVQRIHVMHIHNK